MSHSVLIADDEEDVLKLVGSSLKGAGFKIVEAQGGAEALEKAFDQRPSLIVLDVMLPEMSGLELCRMLKGDTRTRHIPIIMLTAKAQEIDRVVGLELGADDYVTKPFDLQELLARVHTVLRRAHGNPGWITLGAVTIDFENQIAKRGGDEIHLTHREFELLRYLASRAGHVVYRNELLRAVWGYPDNSAYTRAVDHAIARLRKKIEAEPEQPRFIHTAHGDGYSLTPG